MFFQTIKAAILAFIVLFPWFAVFIVYQEGSNIIRKLAAGMRWIMKKVRRN